MDSWSILHSARSYALSLVRTAQRPDLRPGALSYVLLLGRLALTASSMNGLSGRCFSVPTKVNGISAPLGHVDEHDLSRTQLSEEDLLGERVLDVRWSARRSGRAPGSGRSRAWR